MVGFLPKKVDFMLKTTESKRGKVDKKLSVVIIMLAVFISTSAVVFAATGNGLISALASLFSSPTVLSVSTEDIFHTDNLLIVSDLVVNDPNNAIVEGKIRACLDYIVYDSNGIETDALTVGISDTLDANISNDIRFDILERGKDYRLRLEALSYYDDESDTTYNNHTIKEWDLPSGDGISGDLNLEGLDYNSLVADATNLISLTGEQLTAAVEAEGAEWLVWGDQTSQNTPAQGANTKTYGYISPKIDVSGYQFVGIPSYITSTW